MIDVAAGRADGGDEMPRAIEHDDRAIDERGRLPAATALATGRPFGVRRR